MTVPDAHAVNRYLLAYQTQRTQACVDRIPTPGGAMVRVRTALALQVGPG